MAFSTDPSDARLAPPSTPGAATAATPIRRERGTEATPGRLSASARRPTAATPHGRAAYAALQRRRTALFTPGKERRRSLRDQRETPRDPLRALSRLLAPSSQVIHSSSSPSDPGANSSLPVVAEGNEDDEDFSDDFEIERPRLSLNLNEDDELDSELKPPRLSGLEEADYTAQSIELPRRLITDAARSSLGSARYSDYAGPDLRSDDVGIDSGFFPPPVMEEDEDGVVFDNPADLDRSDADELRRQTLGRDSLFPPMEFPDAANESTFVMASMESSPTREPIFMDEDDRSDNAPANEPSDGPDGTPEADRTGPGEPSGLLDLDNEAEGDGVGYYDADETMLSQAAVSALHPSRRRKPAKKYSKHGIEYPSLPQGVVKRLATTFAKTAGASKSKLTPDTLEAIMQATDWFFEQLGDDLQAYSKHASRKTIDESDMMTLMRRYDTYALPLGLPAPIIQRM